MPEAKSSSAASAVATVAVGGALAAAGSLAMVASSPGGRTVEKNAVAFALAPSRQPALRTTRLATRAATSNSAHAAESAAIAVAPNQRLMLGVAAAVCGAASITSIVRRKARARRFGGAARGISSSFRPASPSAASFVGRARAPAPRTSPARGDARATLTELRAAVDPEALRQVAEALGHPADPATIDAVVGAMRTTIDQSAAELEQLMALLGPPQPAAAFDAKEAASDTWSAVSGFFFDPRLQWDENGNVLLDPQGNPLPDNLWTQFVAFQATLIKRLDQAIAGLGVPGSFGFAVASYTLMIRALLYPFIKGQLETTAKIQVLAPRVNELKKIYKDDEARMQQEVGMLYMDLQIDPLGAVIPLLLQLPVFWGLYRAIRRLAIVEYDHLREPFLWIPSLFGPNFVPDPSFNWITQWQGPLINLHPKIGWEAFGLYSILPFAVFLSYKQVLSEATEDKDSPAVLKLFPFLLAFITVELPQAMGIYIATNIASSVALTSYTKTQISSKIPGYDEFVKTGKWPPGVDPEKVLARAFGVQRLTDNQADLADPVTVPEALFSGRADFIPELMKQGKSIDAYDDKGIPASAYTLALDNADMLERLFELGANPLVLDKRGNSLLHYCAGYGRSMFLSKLLEQEGMQGLLDHTNEDGQTALDVARMNLSQDKIADDCRAMIPLLEESGAGGKATTKEDEARFEEAREKKKREESLKAARSALMALAAQSDKAEAKTAEGAEVVDATPASTDTGPPPAEAQEPSGAIADSLRRVKSLDIEMLKKRLGETVTEEQLKKVTERLEKMSPEEVAQFAASGKLSPATKDDAARHSDDDEVAAKEEPAPAPAEERKRVSLLVD